MQGFKSFADPVVIELNDGITCIVGPNGSGKSNISDALRWVLGEQSPKSLRGGKMEDVIFAGTAARKPKGMAEVTLVIDNSSGELPLEYKEVAVTRRMYRSGESEYRINGNECRLKDIKELFMDTGIGVDGYSIIGQGKIQDIVSTKAESRREIFEEAAGVVLYKSRKAEAERKLASATDNLERVRDIIAEIEGRIGGLREDSEKATEFVELRDRYKYLQINIILHNVSGLAKKLDNISSELERSDQAYGSKLEENSKLEKKIELQRVEDAELSAKYESTSSELREKVEELHLMSNRGQINTERLSAIEKDIHRLSSEIDSAQEKLDSERKSYEELRSSEGALSAEKDDAEKALNAALQRHAEHSKKAALTAEEIERRKDRILELSNKNVSAKAEITTLEGYKKSLAERCAQLKSECEGNDELDSSNRARLADISSAYELKENELKKARERIDELADNIISVNDSAENISHSIEKTVIEINRATARRNTIEEMENNYEGYNNAVRQVMSRNFRGIIGTVSELIRVPDGYELAVETALGGSMQNIVCEDDSSAKSAIEWLKSSRAGRATFLPIKSICSDSSSIKHEVSSCAGYLGLASDIVEYDSRYTDIMNYLMSRVIIADTMDHAVSLSKKSVRGYRIVTLEGELISAAGSITGGAYRHKTANLLERKKEIESLGAKIAELNSSLERLKEEQHEKERSVKALKAERAALYESVQQLEIDKNVLKADKEHAEELVKAAGNALEKYEDEIRQNRSDMEKADEMIARYSTGITDAEKEIEELERTAEELISDHERYKQITDSESDEIVSCRIDYSEKQQKILGLNELIERVIDSITEIEYVIEESANEVSELEKQRGLLTSSGEESSEKLETLTKEKQHLEESLAAIRLRTDENRAAQEDALHRQKLVSAELAELQDARFKLEKESLRSETMLDSLKEKLWEEFEVSYAEAADMKDDDFVISSGNKEAKEIRVRMAELGDVNISAIEEYKAVSKRYEFMSAQEADLTKAMNELRSIISNMDSTIKAKFKENFDKVVIYFEESFRDLFGGGTAELRLEDENDPLESGIEIIAQPPGKKLKNINLMSGGEKTLTAIALMFAVLKAKPTPFCILDEVEAALDEANIERFSDYLKNFREIQFALITHQKVTMEHADVLYGITMPEQGISRLLSLKLGDRINTEEFELE